MNAQFPAHREVFQAMTDPSPIAIYHDRLSEQFNQLQDLKLQMKEAIANYGYRELDPAYRQVEVACTSISMALKSIAR